MAENTGIDGRLYDGCFIFFGDVRFDSRLQNLIRSLSKRYNLLSLIQVSDKKEFFSFESCAVVSVSVASSLRGWRKFFEFYKQVLPMSLSIRAKYYCAEDVFSLPIAARAASKHRAKLYYDSRELFFALAQLRDQPLKQRVWEIIERRYILNAKVFTSGDLDSAALAKRYRISTPETIYNYPNFREIPRNTSLREKLNLTNDRILLIYQGVLTDGRGISPMLDAMQKLDKRFFLVLIGDGDLREKIEKKIREMNLASRVFLMGRVPHEQLLELTASADIGLSLIEPISESYKLALPNKLFEYVLCGVPVVVSELPAMKKVIDAHGVGVSVALENSDDVASAISMLAEKLPLYQEKCLTAKLRLNWQTQEERLWSFFQM